ncbi:hypothetical protein FRX31_034309 [Thalictrum thalictroides]|uniref:Uncharacterized protein n=1 Tax=Thalictrum thalictroides TaxID=46969 RepID=A0A7J6UV84_THATH|nr:hypothetical protein FRX31_034309 [Thalictrum thalictroides]
MSGLPHIVRGCLMRKLAVYIFSHSRLRLSDTGAAGLNYQCNFTESFLSRSANACTSVHYECLVTSTDSFIKFIVIYELFFWLPRVSC